MGNLVLNNPKLDVICQKVLQYEIEHFMLYPKIILIKPLGQNSGIVVKEKVEKTINIDECPVHRRNRGTRSQILVLTPDKRL